MILAVQNYGLNSLNYTNRRSVSANPAFSANFKAADEVSQSLFKKAVQAMDKFAAIWEKDRKIITTKNSAFNVLENRAVYSKKIGKDLWIRLTKFNNNPDSMEFMYLDKNKRIYNTLVFDTSKDSFGTIKQYKNVDPTNLRGLFNINDETKIGAKQIEDLNNEVLTYLPKLLENN